MSKCVLDASVILALLNSEPGAKKAESLIPKSIVSAVNVSEVSAELNSKLNIEISECKNILRTLCSEVYDFDFEQAILCSELKKQTKKQGLSLGDRACIALGIHLNLPIYTADKVWMQLDLKNCDINLIR
ncbi:MAG: type II toxin-antitoxin system VapC family toxin [Gammaproteobacteria bacterium]